MKMRLAIAAVFSLLLGGCTQTLTGSIAGGECKVFERPNYAVRGLRPYDQSWINSTVEGGVGACGWARPAPRPPELDAKPGQKKAAAKPTKKRGLLRRIKDSVMPAKRVWPDTTTTPVVSDPAPAVVADPVPPPPAPLPPSPPPNPRDAVDELLDAPPIPSVRRWR